MSEYDWQRHHADCLMRQYCSLPFDDRE